jgi:hypothetical protein
MRRVLFALLAILCLQVDALAQSIGGNASLSVTTTTSNVALPVSGASYPALMIVPAIGTSTEVFYTVGNANTLAALTTSPSLPSGGICFPSVGPNTYVAAITATGSATLRLTQMTQCPQNWAAVGQSSGGSASVTQGTSPWVVSGYNGSVTQSTVTCGTTSTTLLAAAAATHFLFVIVPPGVSNTVWLNYTNTAAVAAAPSVPLLAGASQTWTALQYLPTQQINCISTPAGQAVTLVYN